MGMTLPERTHEFNYDHDGRPHVDYSGFDPLLSALMREHPDMIPAALIAEERRRTQARSARG
jgi:hypothetical protein